MAMGTAITKIMMLICIDDEDDDDDTDAGDANHADAAEVTTTKRKTGSEHGWWTEQVDDAAISWGKGC